jgi:hypothetical protein
VNTCSYLGEHMNLNKTTWKVLQLFTGNLTESFTLREVSRKLDMHVSLAHRAIQPLLKLKVIEKNKHKNLFINYHANHEIIIFAEYLRRNTFFQQWPDIEYLSNEIINKMKEESFVLMIFGSAVTSNKPRDIDLLLLVDNSEKIDFHEKFLLNILSGHNLPFEEKVISFENFYEMLSNTNNKNIVNESLNKHIILYGAELYYRLISRR